METILRSFSNFVDHLNTIIGKTVSWLTLVLVILIGMDVLFRYVFDRTAIWMNELEWQLFALVFLLGGAYTFATNKHVRVDLFYTKFSDEEQALLNLFGSLFLLIPWCILIIMFALPSALFSFSIQEGSPNPGGLPALYAVKFVVVIGFVLMLLQGLSTAAKSLLVLYFEKESA